MTRCRARLVLSLQTFAVVLTLAILHVRSCVRLELPRVAHAVILALTITLYGWRAYLKLCRRALREGLAYTIRSECRGLLLPLGGSTYFDGRAFTVGRCRCGNALKLCGCALTIRCALAVCMRACRAALKLKTRARRMRCALAIFRCRGRFGLVLRCATHCYSLTAVLTIGVLPLCHTVACSARRRGIRGRVSARGTVLATMYIVVSETWLTCQVLELAGRTCFAGTRKLEVARCMIIPLATRQITLLAGSLTGCILKAALWARVTAGSTMYRTCFQFRAEATRRAVRAAMCTSKSLVLAGGATSALTRRTSRARCVELAGGTMKAGTCLATL